MLKIALGTSTHHLTLARCGAEGPWLEQLCFRSGEPLCLFLERAELKRLSWTWSTEGVVELIWDLPLGQHLVHRLQEGLVEQIPIGSYKPASDKKQNVSRIEVQSFTE